ncbi:TetR/AcrR family transcriptional regulator [Nocardia sp. CDC159]|uniref:TetR/AcrR family transcriptional regulator n=1 Tax=Nocardia pulmonis TaxID=2951408 RepID=A0A9X2IW22_9NOCA|nr:MULTISPECIES: TetR/AcrR family transcriptional regulator [Nocardia]MCM6772390.1 TetR/AcrR family transcriptional regulator [Nocardia pulmonis]MCM6784952.1 TetR/AcrR family transcriptional regulator [Nocardia sp. CDC159]
MPTPSRGDARKERILEVALKTFADNGFRGASIAEIADRCGLSQPGLLHHFPTKAALLAAVLDYRDRLDAERLGDEEELRGPAVLHALVRLVEHNVRTAGLARLFTVVTGEAVADTHPAHAWAVGRYRHGAAWLARALDDGIADGTVRPDVDTAAVARQVLAMMDGLQLQWLLDSDKVDMVALFRAYIEDLVTRIAD